MAMITIGLIGGVGPESTIDYYRQLIELYRERSGGDSPSLIINSFDVNKLIRWMTAGENDKAVEYLVPEIARLVRAGADFGLLTANTPHLFFDELQRRSPIPLLSIVEAARDYANSRGRARLALLGTRFTMQA